MFALKSVRKDQTTGLSRSRNAFVWMSRSREWSGFPGGYPEWGPRVPVNERLEK